jgi:uncharacterized protein YybS (DUF2232 family)
LGPALGLLTPLPFVYYGVKRGPLEGAIVGAGAVFLVSLAAGILGLDRAPCLCAEFGFLGLVLAELYRRNLGVGPVVALGTAAMLAFGMVFLAAAAARHGLAPWDLVQGYFRENLLSALTAHDAGGVEGAAEISGYGRALVRVVGWVYPSLVVVGGGTAVWVNALLSRPLLRAAGLPAPDLGRLDLWRAPERLVWVFIAAGFALFLPWEGVRFAAVNVLVVVSAVYCFQGLSILRFYLEKYRAPRLLRAAIYFVILIQQFFLAGLALAGLIDQWADFRKRAGERGPRTYSRRDENEDNS